MDHSSKDKTPFLQKLSGKGFYFALAVCVVAVGGMATAAFAGDFSAENRIDVQPESTVTQTTMDRAVDYPATDVPDTRTVTTTRAATTSTVPVEDANAPEASKLMVLPFGNQLLREFSNGKAIYSDTMADFRTHDGADFAGKAGDKVVAVSGGKVTTVKEDALWGKTITIDHGHGIVSTYCGVTAIVKEGDAVQAGDTIGAVSDIPCELLSGPHLHLEIAVNGETVNPVEAIGLEVAPATTLAPATTTTHVSATLTASFTTKKSA